MCGNGLTNSELNLANAREYDSIFMATNGNVDLYRCPLKLKRAIYKNERLNFRYKAARVCYFSQTGAEKNRCLHIASNSKTKYYKALDTLLMEAEKYCASNPPVIIP